MALTDTAIKAAKPAAKPYKLFDERGLYLLVDPRGARLWRLKYRVDGREKLLAIGAYPDLSLAKARERREEARGLLNQQIDPGARKKAERVAQADTFESIAREWLALQKRGLAEKTFLRKLGWFEDFLFPYLGRHPIAKITVPDLLAALKRIEARGMRETAHRARSTASNVFRYAVATGRAERDITTDLRGALAPVVTTHRAAITVPVQIGQLMRTIYAYRGQRPTEAALKLAPLFFVRPTELRAAEWPEFDLSAEHPEWRIPASRMKMAEEHIVPLADQAMAILRDLVPITGDGRYVFPSLRGANRPLSENTVNFALRSMGYSGDQITGHGFRAMASTCLNEQGFPPDVIELQLAHAERNEVRAAYNRAKRIPERRAMMQSWANFLDKLRLGETTQRAAETVLLTNWTSAPIDKSQLVEKIESLQT
jgi:integrase